ncbi:MAG: hypothetical protein H2058_13525 [Muricauda sp.]|nr:zinc ribbon domain-containing protein [Allomuricauda sp.]MBA4746269.1 hypothetical protein [Allomuricauda sp.]
MNFNVPDKIYKFITLLGILLIGYSYFNTDKVQQKYFLEIDKNRALKDSLLLNEMRLTYKREQIIDIANDLAKQHQVDNPINSSDSLLVFNRVLNGPKPNLQVSDSLNGLWLAYKNQIFKNRLLSKKIEFSNNYLDEEERLKKSYFETNDTWETIGIIFFVLGFLLWAADSSPDEEDKNLKQHDRIYTFCQSCGKRFNSMLKYGTNKDKSLNYAFCVECYKKGKFANPKLTKGEFLNKQRELIKDKNWLTRKILIIRFKNLERWDSSL